MTHAWTRRLARARVLQQEWPFAEEILTFYLRIAALQRDIATGAGADGPGGFIDPLLDLVASEAPEILAREAAGLRALAPDARRLRILPGGPDRWWTKGPGPLPFFTRVLLQPWLESAPRDRASAEPASPSCPWCGSAPLVSLLREDATAAAVRRTLQCSLCSREWEFPRVQCPACGAQKPELLPRFDAGEIPGIRIEACDACLKYVKGIEFAKRRDAEPLVDELASTPLDVIAAERGYSKIAPNLAGL